MRKLWLLDSSLFYTNWKPKLCQFPYLCCDFVLWVSANSCLESYIIAGKQSWNLRWWLLGQCSFDIYQRFFSVLYPSCTDVTTSSAPDNREWFLGLKTPDLDNDQFSVSFFPWHKRVIFYFIFLPMSCCLNGNNIADMRDRLLWWIAWATEPMWGEYQQPTKREKTNRAGTSRWLGYTSTKKRLSNTKQKI